MEPLTHFLTGACIGRAGFNRKTVYATLAAALAAEAADLDVLWGFAGPVEQLKHHRGITHTFIGAPVMAGVVVGAVWLLHRWRERRRSLVTAKTSTSRASTSKMGVARVSLLRSGKAQSLTSPSQPIHFGWLYLTALVAALSHILLDWTNNYGVRPFFPFNPRWYNASIIFIAEPAIWALLLLALIMPGLLGLTDREIGVRSQPFPGRGWAIFALLGMVALWSWRGFEQAKGFAMIAHTHVASEPVLRLALEPYPINPYRWHVILETRDFYQTAEINTWNPDAPNSIHSDPSADLLYKPPDTPAVEAAKQTLIGKVFQDWGIWLVLRDVGQEPVPGINPPQLPPNRQWTTVVFSDLRFGYSFMASQPPGRAPLGGWAYIVDNREEGAEGMGSKEQSPPGGGPLE
jgi:inner membrane protein